MIRFTALLATLCLSAPPLAAHETKAPDGRQETDAGSMHVGTLAKSGRVEVFISDAAGGPVDASGYAGVAIFMVGGKPARIALTPAGGNRLTGTSPGELANPVKGAVQITAPDGATIQGKYE